MAAIFVFEFHKVLGSGEESGEYLLHRVFFKEKYMLE